jgi:hypothetical protein
MPTGTADPREPETPRRTRKQRRQRRKQLEQAKKRKRQTPVAKAPTAEDAETAGELQSETAGELQSEATGELPPDTSPRRRGRPPKPELKDSDLSGFKYFDELAPRFETLHEFGCERDKAGNRTLHYDQFCMGMLLALFNPIVNSLGGLDQATQFSRIRERLGVERMSVSSLSEAARLFDAENLIPIIQSLGKELQPLGKDPRLAEVKHTLTLVDGTLLNALPKILQAIALKEKKGSALVKWRLHAQFEVEKYVPTRIDVTRNGGGEWDERAVMESTVEPGRCYVMDRGYAKFTLFNKIHVASNYVCRLRDNSAYQVLEERPLSEADRAAGVIRDAIVKLGETSKADARPDPQIRLVIVETKPHVKRGKSNSGSTGCGQRWTIADRHGLAGYPGRDHRTDLSVPLVDRSVLPLLQATAGMPAPFLPQRERHQAAGLLRDHRVDVVQPVDRPQAEQADLRDDLLVLPRPGHRRGVTAAFGTTARRGTALPQQTSRLTSTVTSALQ